MGFSVGFIAAPTIRSLVYIQVLDAMGITTNLCILLPGQDAQKAPIKRATVPLFTNPEKTIDLRFDVSCSEYLEEKGSEYLVAPYDDINSDVFIDFLSQAPGDIFVYSGVPGCILRSDLLEKSGKRFLHAHGGDAPRYSGSTAFYYSLLEEGTIAATAFWMNAGLDTGDVLTKIIAPPLQNIDLDYIQDPLIRAEALVSALKDISSGHTKVQPQNEENRMTYHVIHPVLKSLALQKISKS